MNKQQKVFAYIIVLLIIILIVKFMTSNKKLVYELQIDNNNFYIEQTKLEKSTYAEISINKKVFPIIIDKNYKHNKKIISNIYYYEDKIYTCIVPIIDDKIKVDGMCYNKNKLMNLSSVNKNKGIKKYIKNIKEYNINNYLDDLSNGLKMSTITYYKSNEIKKSVAVSTYKGLYNNGNIIELFNRDIYDNNIHTFIDNYYITADYNMNYTFNKFYVIDLKTNKKQKLEIEYDISFDSYIQGIVDDKIYIYDKDNEIQYELDVFNKKIAIISSDKINYYKNNNWEKISKVKANKEILFDYKTLNEPIKGNYFKNQTDTIYYIIDDNNNVYKIYKNNIKLKKYLFNINSNTNLICNDEYIYFVNNNILYYYSDEFGLRKVLKNTEFEFNNTIKYYIY